MLRSESIPDLAICCRDLEKVYPPDVRALDGLDLEVRRGECFGLLGPNGAGKTTTIEILEGLLEPSAGRVEVLGTTWRQGERSLRQRIGISLQETRLPEKLSVLETVRLFRSFYPSGLAPDEAIALVGLEEKSGTWVGKLSGGQRQRVEIACGLVGKPELLFLDEPSTGLDPQSRRGLWEVIQRLQSSGTTVVLTTHYMDEAERLCDRITIIDRGRSIAVGTPKELIAMVGGDHVIEFSADGDPPRNGDLGALPSVREVRSEGDSIHLTVAEPHVTIPALLAWLSEKGCSLETLSTRHATLEDVFVRLTGRHLSGEDSEGADQHSGGAYEHSGGAYEHSGGAYEGS